MPQERKEITVTNSHRYAVHTVGRRFRPGVPRTLTLNERQIDVIRGNPWLWIEGEDYGDVVDLEELTVPQLKEQLRSVGLPVSGTKDELIERLQEYAASEEEQQSEGVEVGEGVELEPGETGTIGDDEDEVGDEEGSSEEE